MQNLQNENKMLKQQVEAYENKLKESALSKRILINEVNNLKNKDEEDKKVNLLQVKTLKIFKSYK